MSLKTFSFLAALVALAGCASTTESVDETTLAVEVATERRFHVSSASFDPLFVEGSVGGSDFTVGTIILNPAERTLKAIIVFGLFPQFYPTTIVRTYTDVYGAVHYEGVSSASDGQSGERSWTLQLLEHGADISADLTTVLTDGRTTRSRLELVPL